MCVLAGFASSRVDRLQIPFAQWKLSYGPSNPCQLLNDHRSLLVEITRDYVEMPGSQLPPSHLIDADIFTTSTGRNRAVTAISNGLTACDHQRDPKSDTTGAWMVDVLSNQTSIRCMIHLSIWHTSDVLRVLETTGPRSMQLIGFG